MAIVNNGTVNSLPESKIPDGYTRPTVTEIADYHYLRDITLTVLKSTVENATHATTMTNIIDDATIGITKQVTDILALDFLGTATVTAYAELTDISNNITPTASTDFYDDIAVSYDCVVKLYVKAV